MPSKCVKSRNYGGPQKRGKAQSKHQTKFGGFKRAPRFFNEQEGNGTSRGRTPQKRNYEPFDFTEDVGDYKFPEKTDKIEPINLLKREISEWRRGELRNDRVKKRLEKLRAPDKVHVKKECRINQAVAVQVDFPIDEEHHQRRVQMAPKKYVTVAEPLKHLEDYLEIAPEIPELTTQSSSSDTLEVLRYAEKLVETARRTIALVQLNVPSNLPSANIRIANLTEEEVDIKRLVALKFDEANGRRVRRQLKDEFLIEPNENQSPNPQALQTDSECRKKSPRKSKKRSVRTGQLPEYSGKMRVQHCPPIDIRNDLVISKLHTLEINPEPATMTSNTGTFQLLHGTCKLTKDHPSLIDAGVQTNLRDSPKIPLADALSRSRCSDLGEKIDESKPEEINKTAIKDASQLGGKRSAGKGFLEFLWSIERSKDGAGNASSDEGPKEISGHSMGALKGMYSSRVSLEAPDTGEVDDLLKRVDDKLRFVSQTEVFQNWERFERQSLNDQHDNCDFISGDNEVVDVLLEPRSRFLSSSSATSGDGPRFSTPLNNSRIPENYELRKNCQVLDSKSDTMKTESNNDGVVSMTRNKLSFEKNVGGDKQSESSADVGNGDSSSGTFPTYSSNKSGSHRSHRSEVESPALDPGKKIQMDFTQRDVSAENMALKGDAEFFEDLKKLKNPLDNLGKSEKLADADNGNFENLGGPTVSENLGDLDNLGSLKSSGTAGNLKNLGGLKSSGNAGNLKNLGGLGSSENSGKKSDILENAENLDNIRDLASSPEISDEERKQDGSSDHEKTSHDISKLSSMIDEKRSCVSTDSREKARNSEDELIGCEKNAESSSRTISNKRSIASFSSSLSSHRLTQKSSNGDYSEGELFLPSSCAYSLGEVVMSAQSGRVVNKIWVNLSSESSPIKGQDHSPGEFPTDIDSNSSFASRGQLR